MSEQQTSAHDDVLAQKKAAHDYLATAIQVLTTRVQYYHEEFVGMHSTIIFLRGMRDQMVKDIEAIEPRKEEPQSKPSIMDLTHIKAEANV